MGLGKRLTLRPVKSSRRRRNPHPRLQTRGNWNFSWKPVKQFDPVKHKRGLQVILLLLLVGSLSLGVLGIGYSSGSSGCIGELRAPSAPCNDPTTLVWQENTPTNLNDFNVGPGASATSNCSNGGADCIQLLPTDTVTTSVVVSKNPIGDLSVAVGKTLAFNQAFQTQIGATFTANATQHWGFYITTNATAPSHAIGGGSKNRYNPLDDPSVLFLLQADCVSGGANCGGGADTGPVYQSFSYLLRLPGSGDTLTKEDTGYCGSGGSCITHFDTQHIGIGFNLLTEYLNYSGQTNAGTTCSVVANVVTGAGCTWQLFSALTGSLAASGIQYNPSYPFLGGNFYIGFFSQIPNYELFWLPNPGTPAFGGNAGMDVFTYVPSPTTGTGPVSNLDSGGFVGSAFNHYINGWAQICNSLSINAFCAQVYTTAAGLAQSLGTEILQGLLAAGSAILSALGFFEGILVSILNTIGNALGLGNVGTSLQTFINAVITFFASGQFSNILSNFPSAISRLIDILTVYFPWLAQAITAGVNVATFLVKGVGFALTALTFATNIGSGVTVTILIVLFFVYTGDNSLGGVLEFWQTTLWLVVGLGLKFLTYLVNFILDVVTNLIGLIPKPFVQMATHALPRLPIVNTEASFVPPSGLMGEIKNGNLFAVALWISGLLFTDLYESASPALPGSIGALLPATAGKLVALTGLIPLLELLTFFVWTAAIFIVPIGWFANAMDLGQLPVDSSLGNRPQTHFGISVRRAEKHSNLRGSISGFRSAFRRKQKLPIDTENIN